jgi:hypothetical protein
MKDSPSGSYCGSFSTTFKGKIEFNSPTSVNIMGNAEDFPLSCSNEAITISTPDKDGNDIINMVDVSKTSDCLGKYLGQFGVNPADFAVEYNGNDDTVTVKGTKAPVNFVFSKCTEYEVHFEAPKAKDIKDLYRVNSPRLGDPAGSYCGSYQTIATLKATVINPKEASLVGTLYGSPITCPTEAAEYDATNKSVVFPNIYNPDDCLGKQLGSFSIPPQAFVVTYDPTANTLNATILSQAISLILSPCTLEVEATPSGKYCGGVSSIVSVNATIITLTEIKLDGNVGGQVDTCNSESVDFNSSTDKVVFPNIGNANDCLGNLLKSYSVDPADLVVKYHPTADCIEVSLSALFADFNLTKSC